MPNMKVPLLAGALLFAASPALGQEITVYDNEADYAAAVGADETCLDFNGSSGALVAGSSFSADVTFGSPEASDPTLVNWSSDAISDAGSTLSPNGVGPVDGTFTGTAAAFKFTFLSNGTPATVELYDEGAVLLGSFTAPNAPGFFGVVSTTPVKRFVIKPGDVNDGTGFLDRFFIDDFCVTAVIAAPPPPPPPPAPDLTTMCHDFAAAVAAADASAFRGRNRQHALANKLRVVCNRIEGGGVDALCAALHKLQHDILPKMDGDKGPKDWVTDATVQQALEDQANALITALEDQIAALGGCPSDPSDDDGDDGDGGGAGGGGAGSQGAAHSQGHGNGHNK